MPIDTSVKFIHSGMVGAPSLTGAPGTLIAVLDACLVNGFGVGNVDSIVIAGGIATVTRSAGHPFEVDSVAEIAGAIVSGGSINGQQKVLSVINSNSYTFDATGLANQTATTASAITHKVAPLGWSKPFSGTNLAAYTHLDVTGTGVYLRVDDSNARDARVIGYETMTTIDAGEGMCPTTLQISGGGYWGKSAAADSVIRDWVVYGDRRFFYFMPIWSPSRSGAVYGFGDPISFKSPEPYQAILQVSTSATFGSSSPGADLCSSRTDTAGGLFIFRGISGLGAAVPSYPFANSSFPASNSRSGAGSMIFPSPADNGLYLSSMTCIANSCVRNRLPGLYHSPQALGGHSAFPLGTRVSAVAGLPGKTLRALSSDVFVCFVDVTGPIR